MSAPVSGNEVIYLDYAATTPVDPQVMALMQQCLGQDGDYANPSSTHGPGRTARARVERARGQVAGLVGAQPGEIVFTSGATEADNLALRGAALYHAYKGRHLVTCRTEHRAVLDPCRALEKEGFEVTWLVPEADGRVGAGQLARALRPDTVLVSLMHVNNETGLIQDIAALGALCRQRGVLFHVDAAQSAGKLPISVHEMGVDLMSFSAHKIYGPKGAGALFVSRAPRCNLAQVLHGGGQEQGLRPGTLATHQIAGMGLAFELAGQRMQSDLQQATALRRRLWQGLQSLGGVRANGDQALCLPNIVNCSFDGVEGESLMFGLPGLALSSGSACASAAREPSYVLRALGRDDQAAQASLRFSLGRPTTAAQVDRALEMVAQRVRALRALAPQEEPAA